MRYRSHMEREPRSREERLDWLRGALRNTPGGPAPGVLFARLAVPPPDRHEPRGPTYGFALDAGPPRQARPVQPGPFGALLKRARQRAGPVGLGQKEVVAELRRRMPRDRVPQTYISWLETGRARPTPRVLDHLVDILGIAPDEAVDLIVAGAQPLERQEDGRDDQAGLRQAYGAWAYFWMNEADHTGREVSAAVRLRYWREWLAKFG